VSELEPIEQDGELIGWQIEADDGALLALDLDGDIVGALNPYTGELLDHTEYALTEPEPDYADPYGIDDRLAALEQRVAEPANTEYVPVYQQAPLSQQQISDDLVRQGKTLEAALGRPLLLSEKRRLAEAVSEAAVAGERRPDLFEAAEQIALERQPLLDMDTGHRGRDHEARVQFMAERLSDRERQAAHERGEDDITQEQPPRSQGMYDLDRHEDRVAYALDRMRGLDIPAEDTYSSSDLPPDAGDL
jgi:hypothetical protein